MEDTRLLQPINIGTSSVEKGSERFREHWLHFPATYHWRNNLTALSQRYNLYFVAIGSNIAVYVPSFPFQKLGSQPALSITPEIANPAARGFIDPRDPHVLNHLMVGDLGTTEVLLLCTDSGNVVAYHTKSIQVAVRKQSVDPRGAASINLVDLRPFFTYWVFESAWGLAIHSHARMIAVSANTPHNVQSEDDGAKVTVFAFALSSGGNGDRNDAGEDEEEVEDQTGWQLWQPHLSRSGQPDRSVNYKVVLAGSAGHNHNIPNISFVQSTGDETGNWLMSTDIGGEMKAWRIWQGECLKTWDFANQTTGLTALSLRHRAHESGWNVVALDPAAFRLVDTTEEFCGWHKALQYHGYRGNDESFDITNIVRSRVPGNSQLHPALRRLDDMSEDDDPEQDETTGSDISVDNSSEDEETISNEVSFGVLGGEWARTEDRNAELVEQTSSATQGVDMIASSSRQHGNLESSLDSLEAGNWGPPFSSGSTTSESAHGESGLEEPESIEEEQMEPDSGDVESGGENADFVQEEILEQSGVETHSWGSLGGPFASSHGHPGSILRPSAAHRHGPWLSRNLRKAYGNSQERDSRRADQIPHVPILHCSKSHVRMLRSPASDSPHVFCAQILKQLLPPAIEDSYHAHLDRLNMLQQVPELGIVIIATQIGRCAVCTLTKKRDSGHLGFRVDWVLPTRKQERAHQRPLAPLLGIAVGPVQGRMKRSKTEARKARVQGRLVDGVIDGVPTSFDPNVVVLSGRKPATQQRPGGWPENQMPETQEHQSEHSYSPNQKRKRLPSDASMAGINHQTSQLRLEQRPWMRYERLESWRATENSRRYRLMLTYTDQTVLTYELSREAENIGIGTEWTNVRKNFRNRDPF